jgi:serine phosphatase RsbU (regulator of sigma subunit)
MLFQEGDAGDRLYIVLSGAIAIIKSLGTPDERLVNIRRVGEFIGEMSLLTGDGARTASARAHTAAELLELTSADFEALMAGRPALALQMLKVQSRRLRDAHDHTIRDLHEKNERLAQAYAELQEAQGQLIAQEALRRELRVAHDIQQSMLPAALPALPGVELGARMVPAREVGGDFYDVFPLDGGRVGLAVGDVCGKGVPAALYMALASSLLRAEAARNSSPEETLTQLNRHLSGRDPGGLFVTLLYGVLDPQARTLDYVRAGHEYPLLWGPGRPPAPAATGRSIPLGLLPEPVIERVTLELPPGAGLLFFSDGVTEAHGPDLELLGQGRLAELIRASAAPSAAALCDELLAALADHQGDGPQADDITLLAIRML